MQEVMAAPAKQEESAEPLPIEPGHVMAREHYERMAREAAAQQK